MNKTDILTHLGEDRKTYFSAVAPPIIQTSNFTFDTVEDLKRAFEYERGSHLYTRGNNPTVTMCAKKLQRWKVRKMHFWLEAVLLRFQIPFWLMFNLAIILLCVQNAYSWANKLMENFLPRFNVNTTFVDGSDVANYKMRC